MVPDYYECEYCGEKIGDYETASGEYICIDCYTAQIDDMKDQDEPE
jgi:DNA-directed RNA polymerase subunit RPC12/RpoP